MGGLEMWLKCLLCKLEALSSNPSPIQKKKKKTKTTLWESYYWYLHFTDKQTEVQISDLLKIWLETELSAAQLPMSGL
jgi:hypothetical protein